MCFRESQQRCQSAFISLIKVYKFFYERNFSSRCAVIALFEFEQKCVYQRVKRYNKISDLIKDENNHKKLSFQTFVPEDTVHIHVIDANSFSKLETSDLYFLGLVVSCRSHLYTLIWY
jgi:hypothetical protein